MRVGAFSSFAAAGAESEGLGANWFWSEAGHKTYAARIGTVAALERLAATIARGLAGMRADVGDTAAIAAAQSAAAAFTAAVEQARAVVRLADEALTRTRVADKTPPPDVDPVDWRRAYTIDYKALVDRLQAAERLRPGAETAVNAAIEDTSRRKVAAGKASTIYQASREPVDPARDMRAEWRAAGVQEATGINPAAVGAAVKSTIGTVALGGGMIVLGLGALAAAYIFGGRR